MRKDEVELSFRAQSQNPFQGRNHKKPLANKKRVGETPQPVDLFGAGTTNRTRDLLITSQLLYRLSYAGQKDHWRLVPPKWGAY